MAKHYAIRKAPQFITISGTTINAYTEEPIVGAVVQAYTIEQIPGEDPPAATTYSGDSGIYSLNINAPITVAFMSAFYGMYGAFEECYYTTSTENVILRMYPPS